MTEKKGCDIADLGIDSTFLSFRVGDEKYQFRLSERSPKLANASEEEKKEFSLSPSGYGIHWESIDEDVSIKGLIRI